MIEKEIYIVRHGQTEHNAKGIVQGKGVDLSLNELGKKQTNAFFEAYKHIPFEKIYTSTLRRAKETAEPFRQLGIPLEIFSELDEISWGNLEGAISTSESDATFQSLLARWKQGELDAKPSPTGESPLELQERQQRFIKYFLATPHEKILIATHGRFIRAFMCTLTNTPLTEMDTFHHENLCLYKVNLHSNGQFEIELYCERKHLADL